MAYDSPEHPGQLCLNCGKPVYGRTDKKFCSPECKNGWHYFHEADYRKCKYWAQTALGRNHKILKSMIENGVDKLSLVELQMRGFTPRLVTGHISGDAGIQQYACYNIMYKENDTEIFDVHPAHLYK